MPDPTPNYTFRLEDITRIFRAVTFYEELTKEGFNRNSLATPVRHRTATSDGWPVEVTGEVITSPPEEAGQYPGTMYLPDPTADPPWRESECRIRALPDETLAVGDKGLGRFVGVHKEDGPPVKRLPILVLVAGLSDARKLTVEEVDGDQSVTDVTTVQFHQDDGFRVEEPAAGTARIRLTPHSYYPAPPTPGATCTEWYTGYLHLGHSTVQKGQTVQPGQLLGHLGPYSTGAHLHFSVADGNQDQNPLPGAITAGVAANIESWITGLGYPITGTHIGVPPAPPANFTGAQLAVIEAHFAFPLDETEDWEAAVSSPFHTGWDYYALDFVIDGGATNAEGQPVYAAFSGSDVRTTVHYSGYTPGVGWVVILRHAVGDCPEDGGADEDTRPQVAAAPLYLNGLGLFALNFNPAQFQIINNRLAFNLAFFCEDCCDPPALSATAEVAEDPPWLSVDDPAEFNFTGTASGGVGAKTYSWDFNDGGPGSLDQNPTHTFTRPGRYRVELTVTDACGQMARALVWVYVHGDWCDCEANGVAPPRWFDLTLANGTDDFAGANGVWRMYYIGPPVAGSGNPCAWAGDNGPEDGWSGIAQRVGPDYSLQMTFVDDASDGLIFVDYSSDQNGTTCENFTMTIANSAGSGTEPDDFTATPDETAPGCVPCSVETTCCPDDPIPGTLTAVVTGGSCADTYTLYYGTGCAGWGAEICSIAGPVLCLDCVADVWTLTDGTGTTYTLEEFTCDPPHWEFSATGGSLGITAVEVNG